VNADNRNTEHMYIYCSKKVSVRFFSDPEVGIKISNYLIFLCINITVWIKKERGTKCTKILQNKPKM